MVHLRIKESNVMKLSFSCLNVCQASLIAVRVATDDEHIISSLL